MKFVHTSDWHLGYAQHNLEERFNDFFRAAFYTAKKIVEEIKPDFVIHTGDIFHHSKPSPGTFRHAYRVLQVFKDADIPFYLIRGNHDAKTSRELAYGGSSIKLLEDLGLIEYIDDSVAVLDQLQISIVGVGHYFGTLASKKIKEVLNNHPLQDDHYRILAVHNFIQGQLENVSEVIPVSLIDELNFNYVAGGHYHIPWSRSNVNIWVPGSCEATSANDWRRDDLLDDKVALYSSFYEVEAQKANGQWVSNVKRHNVPVRPKIFFELETDLSDPNALTNEITTSLSQIISNIQQYIELNHPNVKKGSNYWKIVSQPMARIVLKSPIRPEDFRLIDQAKIKRGANLLHFHLSFETEDDDFLYSVTDRVTDLGVDQVIEQLVKERGGDELLTIVKNVIDQFKGRPASRDFSDKEIDELVQQAVDPHEEANAVIENNSLMQKTPGSSGLEEWLK